jgi:sulfofructose kinase
MPVSVPIDIVGVGQNAVDRVVLVEHFPGFGAKQRFEREFVSPGGQVATAMAACARLGMNTRYVGTIGDDEAGRIQRASLAQAGLADSILLERTVCATQSAYIVIDQSSGERTILWRRDPALALLPGEVQPAWLEGASLLHLDATDLAAALVAAKAARARGLTVVLDADTPHPQIAELFAVTDIVIAAEGLLEQITGLPDPALAAQAIGERFHCRAAGITLGVRGSLLYASGELHRTPAFEVDCLDTTGSGDVFHGAFCYAVWIKMTWPDALQFASAAAAINCQGLGARGHLPTLAEVQALIARGATR